MYFIKNVNENVLNLFLAYKYRGRRKIDFLDQKSVVRSAKTILKRLFEIAFEDVDKFKLSIFNIYLRSCDGWVVYNTLFNTMARLNRNEYRKLIGRDKKIGKKLKAGFIKSGLWCRKGVNEKSVYLELINKYNANSFINSRVSFNLTTTTKCNARCSYCYEKGVRKLDFPEEKKLQLLDFIESKLKENKTRNVIINWFGGETLLNSSFICDITYGLKLRNIDFSSSIITNGSLINAQMIKEQFANWNVKDVQITIDGLKKTYETTKRYLPSTNFTFESLIDVIGLFADTEIDVHLRMNVCRSNCNEMINLVEFLQTKFSSLKNIVYYPAFITGIHDDLASDEKMAFVKRFLSAIKNPFKVNMLNRIDSVPLTHPCMVNDPNSYTVDVNGMIYSCEHRVGRPEFSIGSLDCLDEKANKVRATINIPTYCHNCVYLPKCCGGCSANDETGDERCMIVRYLIQSYLEIIAEN